MKSCFVVFMNENSVIKTNNCNQIRKVYGIFVKTGPFENEILTFLSAFTKFCFRLCEKTS